MADWYVIQNEFFWGTCLQWDWKLQNQGERRLEERGMEGVQLNLSMSNLTIGDN